MYTIRSNINLYSLFHRNREYFLYIIEKYYIPKYLIRFSNTNIIFK